MNFLTDDRYYIAGFYCPKPLSFDWPTFLSVIIFLWILCIEILAEPSCLHWSYLDRALLCIKAVFKSDTIEPSHCAGIIELSHCTGII